MEIKNLEPKALWNSFAELNAVPRPSKKEERVIQFMIDFANSLKLEVIQDQIGNVIIKKPATQGKETAPTTVLQAHLDMVHQKNTNTEFDFDTQGIEMFVDGDWVRAKGTTLGADNGIGVAAIMAILSSTDIPHPAIEALFTIDEETGMTGAMQVDPSNITGTILLNLDTEDDDELSIGCAGGIDTNTSYPLKFEDVPADFMAYEISIRGLLGGHSGMDIHLGRANANKLLNRIFVRLKHFLDIRLCTLNGGSLRNAIPRESSAIVVFNKSELANFTFEFSSIRSDIQNEFREIETEMIIKTEETKLPLKCITKKDFDVITKSIYAVPNGVFRMSPDIENLVETSSSLAIITFQNDAFITQSLQRSSVDSTKLDVALSVRYAFEANGVNVVQNGEYPGWQPNPNSTILLKMKNLYTELFDEEPKVKACHAGLECGILLKAFPNMDMISFGPNIRGAHSPDECVQISSVQKFWLFYLQTLDLIS